jgi:hypothetical protein
MIVTGDCVRTRLRRDRHAALSLSLSSPVRLPAAAQHAPAVSGTSGPTIEGPPELQDIMGGTDERPLPAHLPHPAQQELSIAAALPAGRQACLLWPNTGSTIALRRA